ncbi:MAG: protein kinase [Pyrinomonadaceae bacterium]
MNELSGKLVADKYLIGELIREGALGDLYHARHEMMDRPVAIKILPQALAMDARWARRFIDEERTASTLSHPNILSPIDFGTDGKGVSYAVFDAISGRTLRDVVPHEPDSDTKSALSMAHKIAVAVTAAHGKNIFHGRLTPENIFLIEDSDAEIKVFGFGSDPLSVDRDTAPQYLAPEQSGAFPAADERSDVYSLGVILYEMLTGVVPFDGATVTEIAGRRSTEPPAPLSAFNRDFHPEIEPILLTAIAVDPDKRYQTMAAFAEDLGILCSRVGPAEKTAAASGASGARNLWKTATFALAGIAILAVALIYATSVRQTDATVDLQADAGSLPVQPIGPATGAQEESLAKLPVQTEAEILAAASMANAALMSDLPGGDGYNAWANGGAPPPGAPQPGAPLQQPYFPQGGQVYTIDPSGGSQFMPQEGGGVILVPVPANTSTAARPEPTPKTTAANTVTQPGPETAATPKPMATPPPKAGNAKPIPKKPETAPKPSAKPGSDLEIQ